MNDVAKDEWLKWAKRFDPLQLERETKIEKSKVRAFLEGRPDQLTADEARRLADHTKANLAMFREVTGVWF